MKKNMVMTAGMCLLLAGVLAFTSCGESDPEVSPGYTVKVSPESINLVPGESRQFNAELYRDGNLVTDDYSIVWEVSGNDDDNTTIGNDFVNASADFGILTIAADEAAPSLVVKAVIAYGNASYDRTATVTVIPEGEANNAFSAIEDAANANDLYDALQDSATVIPSKYLDADNKDAYWTELGSFTPGDLTPAENKAAIIGKLKEANGERLFAVLWSAENVSDIIPLFTQAKFASVDGEDLWNLYTTLTPAQGVTLANAVFANKATLTDFDSMGTFWGTTITILHIQSYLDAAIAENADRLVLQNFVDKVKDEFGMEAIEPVKTPRVTAIKALLADSAEVTDFGPDSPNPLNLYINAEDVEKLNYVIYAAQVVYGLIDKANTAGEISYTATRGSDGAPNTVTISNLPDTVTSIFVVLIDNIANQNQIAMGWEGEDKDDLFPVSNGTVTVPLYTIPSIHGSRLTWTGTGSYYVLLWYNRVPEEEPAEMPDNVADLLSGSSRVTF
jgi:hypothetical protein